MNDLFDNELEPRPEPVTWPRVIIALISALTLLGFCAGCVAIAWIWQMKP